MSQKIFYICNIIAENDEDYQILIEHFGNYPVRIFKILPEELYFDIPTLVVGWNFIKDRFPKQNIIDKEISANLFWSFSKSENQKDFYSQSELFFTESVKKWLPENFKLFDLYLNKETIDVFLESNINKNKKTFIYFHAGALYMFNNGNNFAINIKSFTLSRIPVKNIVLDILNSLDVVAFSYENISGYTDIENLKDILVLDSLRWVKYGVETLDTYFNIIPGFKIEKFIPFLMSRLSPIGLDSEEVVFYKRMCERDVVTSWLSSREIAFSTEFKNSKLNFKIRKKYKLAKIHYSNKRTITGRITSRDVYNPQNLQNENDDRKNIISRFEDGKILVFDYVSFEPKISIYETKNDEYINKYKDLHYEVACVLYDRSDVTIEERKFAKSITNPLLYGEGEISLLKKLAIFSEPEYKLYQVRKFLKPIIDLSNTINSIAKESGCVLTPQGSIVKVEKVYAGFNNYIQAYASEIIVDKIFEIKEFLKPYKTQFLFQVHDSLVFDLHPSESSIIDDLMHLLSTYKHMRFNLSSSIGLNYKELSEVFYKVSE